MKSSSEAPASFTRSIADTPFMSLLFGRASLIFTVSGIPALPALESRSLESSRFF
jgi:hypothetical protein